PAFPSPVRPFVHPPPAQPRVNAGDQSVALWQRAQCAKAFCAIDSERPDAGGDHARRRGWRDEGDVDLAGQHVVDRVLAAATVADEDPRPWCRPIDYLLTE